MKVFFSGSRRKIPTTMHESFASAAESIGREFGRRGYTALLHSDGANTLDHHLVRGLRNAAAARDMNPVVELHRGLGSERIYADRTGLAFRDVTYPRPEAKRDKRLGARVGAVAAADAVMLMGGDRGTRRVRQIARSLKKPIVAIPAFKGSAETAFNTLEDRYIDNPAVSTRLPLLVDWRDKASALAAVDLCELLSERHVYFISYPHTLQAAADHMEAVLSRGNAVVFRDERDLEFGADLRRDLEGMICKADTILIVWSSHSRDSEWCKWELERARSHQEENGRPRRILLIREDDTPLPDEYKGTLQIEGGDRASREAALGELVGREKA